MANTTTTKDDKLINPFDGVKDTKEVWPKLRSSKKPISKADLMNEVLEKKNKYFKKLSIK